MQANECFYVVIKVEVLSNIVCVQRNVLLETEGKRLAFNRLNLNLTLLRLTLTSNSFISMHMQFELTSYILENDYSLLILRW